MTDEFDVRRIRESLGGMVVRDVMFQPLPGEPHIKVRSVSLGSHPSLSPMLITRNVAAKPDRTFHGAGTGLSDMDCLIPAIAEAMERYSASTFSHDQFLVASASELGAAALDLGMLPVCSMEEYLHPKCPLVDPSKAKPIRWVRGVNLFSGKSIYLPAVLVYLYAGYQSAAERLSCPITTGCAAHTNYEQALLGGLLEVVERDALSIVWLQKLTLPKIRISSLPAPFEAIWNCFQSSSKDLQYTFFNATTDLRIPTAYCIRRSPENPIATTLVTCASALTMAEAVAKTIRDVAASLIGFRKPRPVPTEVDDFTEVHHGATFMANAKQASAFDFLLSSNETEELTSISPACTSSLGASSALQHLVQRLHTKGHQVYAVDLSTDEALRCGLKIVRVLVPSLQPLPYKYRARYLGHSRLYDAPRLMGYLTHDERGINPWPNPFA